MPPECPICHEVRELRSVNVGDDVAPQWIEVCSQCVAERLLPRDD